MVENGTILCHECTFEPGRPCRGAIYTYQFHQKSLSAAEVLPFYFIIQSSETILKELPYIIRLSLDTKLWTRAYCRQDVHGMT